MLYRNVLRIKTGPEKFVNITDQIMEIVDKCLIKDGLCHLFLKATTASLLLQENDMMLMADMEKTLELLTPKNKMYQHPRNSYSHIRSALLKQEITIPVFNGRLELGQWQSILLLENDVRPREREIILTISGE